MEKEWFVVNTYSGHENKVKEKLLMRAESMGMQDYIFRVIVPEQEETEIKDGVTKKRIKKLFPGYILVEMIMTDEAWYVVRNTPGVTGFIGSSGGGAKPIPVKGPEIEAILRRIGQSDKTVEVNFKVGDVVKILSGPFSGMEGTVESMNDQTQVATVLIILFGRETPTDLNYVDIEPAL